MMAAMRKLGFVAVVLVLLPSLFMSSCHQDEQHPTNSFTVRAISVHGAPSRWDFAVQQGLVRIGEELGGGVESLRVTDSADAGVRITEIGRQQVDLVFCIGGWFEKTRYTESAAFPGTVFVLLPGNVRRGNVAGIQFLPEEAGYVAGAVASVISSSNRVGVLRGEGQPWLESVEEGFLAGFRANRRRAAVTTADGAEGAAILASQGVGVALYATDFAEPDVLAAARASGLKLVSTDRRVMVSDPDLVFAAVEIDVAEAMVRVAREVRDGVFSARVFAFDLGSGVVDVSLNGGLPDEVREEAVEALANARAEVTAGYVAFDELGL